VQLRKRR